MYGGKEITYQEYIDLCRQDIKLDTETQALFDLIFNSDLAPVLKVGMIDPFTRGCRGFFDVVQDNCVECNMDACLEFLGDNNLEDETQEAEEFLKNHFLKNLPNFPYSIRTEDYCRIA